MSGLLANLVGAATAALNLRSQDAPTRAPKAQPQDGGFASALSAALTPRQKSEAPGLAETVEEAAAGRGEAEGADGSEGAAAGAEVSASGPAATAGVSAGIAAPAATRAPIATAATTDSAAAAAELDAAAPGARVTSAAKGEPATAPAAAADSDSEAMPLADTTSATAAASAPAGPNPTRVTRSLEGLNPEFRARLDRVIDRMEAEHGHKVQIVETVRDQSRQEYLYAQGRTRPGPVVTWTTSSNHTQGRAADLLVDGTYDNPLAMVRLARIAREEGLRTLGARDPGHVELPAGVRVERMAVGADASTSLLDNTAARAAEASRTAALTQSGGTAGVARVAQVASVAQVAQVATVARVATPGSAGRGAVGEAPATPLGVPEQTPPTIAGQVAASGGDASSDGERREGRSPAREIVTETSTEASPRVTTNNPFGAESRMATAATAEVRGAPASFGADAAERIARVLQLQDTAPTRPLSQMVLRLDNAAGGEDRIRVDLRGSSVGASLNVSDPVTAARLQSELGQLQRALEGRGLQAEHLSVTSPLAGRELADALRGALPMDPGQRSSQDPGSQRDGWNGRPGERDGDADSEQPRQRSRKHSQQERNT